MPARHVDKPPPPRLEISYRRCKACAKRAYADKLDALTVASRAAWSGTQRPYECPAGNGWHLTHKPDRYERNV